MTECEATLTIHYGVQTPDDIDLEWDDHTVTVKCQRVAEHEEILGESLHVGHGQNWDEFDAHYFQPGPVRPTYSQAGPYRDRIV